MKPTRLPETFAQTVLVSGEYPEWTRALKEMGLHVIVTEYDSRLPEPVSWHPDMQVCLLDGQIFVLKESPLKKFLAKQGLCVRETTAVPENVYPGDVLCNALAWNKFLLCNASTLDMAIREHGQRLGFQSIPVKQGYAACSTALVDGRSAITADQGVAKALACVGMHVLKITPGFLRLPGYDTGLFGGCCGLLAPDLMVFAGSLANHPDGKKIQNFLGKRGICVLELMEGPLTDVGGLLVLS
ncbi:MAG: hypothetical protein HFE94_08365 [Acutalibacter sp.]|nr:hypothetical protein [Acutalibacter sp.]